MHWFWRALIAIAIGLLFGILSVGEFGRPFRAFAHIVSRTIGSNTEPLPVAITYFVPCSILVLLAYAALTRIFPRVREIDHETRCRKCHYILRGLTEPRCPECGERI